MNDHVNSETDQAIGALVDDRPMERPGPVTLLGRYGQLEKLSINHATMLWDALQGHDHMWTYMPSYRAFSDAATFSAWVSTRAALDDPYSYAIVDKSERALGILALMEIRPTHRVCEVGHVVYSPAMQRTPLGTEAQYLLARYAFETLGARRYEWKCDALNTASRNAALRFGFILEGILRQHMIAKGRTRDTAIFSMLDSEWHARRTAFEHWLAPENFDIGGLQQVSMRDLNGGAVSGFA